ncbi:MAG: hypothetical protein JWL70_1381 [Acidimicrobiia bacterium]|nr:hypothetical protein [Acidimicrobiia bacterium]
MTPPPSPIYEPAISLVEAPPQDRFDRVNPAVADAVVRPNFGRLFETTTVAA